MAGRNSFDNSRPRNLQKPARNDGKPIRRSAAGPMGSL